MEKTMTYSFCETIAAYVLHIRPLTDAGRKLGGGADTEALCGAKALWDLNAPIPMNLTGDTDGLCRKCVAVYEKSL